jgi:Concanavalin A-like lectin/glucanases superfamily
MAVLARFVKGGYIFDVSSPPYRLAADFVPPSANIVMSDAGGTSLNRYGGRDKVSERAENMVANIPIIYTGGSEAEVANARRNLAAFLALGSDLNNPMYFEFRPNVIVEAEPLFGQFGANRRLEVVHVPRIDMWSRYGFGTINGRGERVDIPITFKPFFLGRQQILGNATGGISEDLVGVVSGFPKGLSIPKATTNDFTNPIFAHATWDTSWDTGADLVSEENTDRRYILAGNSSAKLLSTGSGDPAFKSDLSLLTGSYHLSCYAKLPSGAAVTSSHIFLVFEGSAVTTTYTSVGNGWYRLNYANTTTAGTRALGVAIVLGVVIYVEGFQIEYESSFVTEPTFGGLAGVASSGTIFESDVTRAAASLTFPVDDIINLDEGTIRIVWDARYAASGGVSRYFFADSNGSLEAYLDGAHKYHLSDGTNAAISASANQPSNQQKLVLHFVFGGGQGLKVYVDGSQEATDSTYAPPSTKATTIYLGSDEAGANQANGIFMEFSSYDVAMTSDEVLADYNAISPLLDSGVRISPIPFLWTKDGDGIVDNCDDSTRDNWAIAGGIPGTHPAITRIDGELSSGFDSYALFMSNFLTSSFIRPGDILFGEQQGTTDASTSGGEYNQKTVSTTSQSWSTALTDYQIAELYGRWVTLFCRLYDAGSNLQIAFSSFGSKLTDYHSISTTTAYRLFKTDPLFIADLTVDYPNNSPGYNYKTYALAAKRTIGSAAVRVDFIILMPEPMIRLYPGATAGGSPEGFSYDSGLHRAISKTSADVSLGRLEKRGKKMELEPGVYNGLITLIGSPGGPTTITHTLTYERIYIIPRWSVL